MVPALQAALIDLMAYWGVESWDDLAVFSSNDLAEVITKASNFGELETPIHCKCLGFLLDYAHSGKLLFQGTTMQEIIKSVSTPLATQTASALTMATTSTPAASGHSIERKTVPTLDHFSGKNEDYFSWSEKSMNKLGTAGLAWYLYDTQLVVDNPEVAEAVFYCLKNALHGGHSQHVATALADKADLNPCTLWATLTQYFDTALNQANVALYEIQHLIGLQLDADVLPSKFISDFNDSMLHLTKNKAKLAADNDTLSC